MIYKSYLFPKHVIEDYPCYILPEIPTCKNPSRVRQLKLVSEVFLFSILSWNASRPCRPAGGWKVDKGAMHWFIPSLSGEVGFTGSSGRSWWRGKMVVMNNGMTGLHASGSI